MEVFHVSVVFSHKNWLIVGSTAFILVIFKKGEKHSLGSFSYPWLVKNAGLLGFEYCFREGL